MRHFYDPALGAPCLRRSRLPSAALRRLAVAGLAAQAIAASACSSDSGTHPSATPAPDAPVISEAPGSAPPAGNPADMASAPGGVASGTDGRDGQLDMSGVPIAGTPENGGMPGGSPPEGEGMTGPAPTPGTGICAVEPKGEQTVSLAGTWNFVPVGGAQTTIEVPGGGWVAHGFTLNSATYSRTLTVPDLGQPQVTEVEFGAVNHRATLSIEGRSAGTTNTSFTPAVFDVTALAPPGSTHQVSVEVQGRNALRQGAERNYRYLIPEAASWSPHVPQGIFRSANVRALPALHVSEAFVRTDVENDRLSIDASVTNGGTTAVTAQVSVELSSWNCDVAAYPTVPSQSVSVAPGQTVRVTLGPVPWGLGPASYWWPNVPYQPGYRARLHNAAITVAEAGADAARVPHTFPVRFGFRQTRQVGPKYELNGVAVNFRGDSLQGVNYDSIATASGGTSDAYDLVPGFLPPSANNPGWPGAVDNYQRLNFNVVRVHQEPASPYMLDVADELGLMIIDETAIRGTENQEDFVTGEQAFLSHAAALVLRDRNHPAVIRWSQSNEADNDPGADSPEFERKLYDAMMAEDDTRPISADSVRSGPPTNEHYALITAPNFTVFEHYPGGWGNYPTLAVPSTTRPFGVGEFVSPADNTHRGLGWFATGTVQMRVQGATETRPYTLLSAWASVIPGVTAESMTLENDIKGFELPAEAMSSGGPVFGAENLAEPFSEPLIQRVQRAFNPVAVVDVAYWNANRLSNARGEWPAVVETVARGATLTRNLMVFNDTFSGTSVDVAWELHADSPTGPIAAQGQQTLDIPLAGRAPLAISIQTPATGNTAYLVLRSSKAGQELFFDDGQRFQLAQ